MRRDLSWCACLLSPFPPFPFFPIAFRSSCLASPLPDYWAPLRIVSASSILATCAPARQKRKESRRGKGRGWRCCGRVWGCTNSRIVQRRLDAFFGLIRWLIDLRRRHTREEGRRAGRGMPWFQCLHHHLLFSCQYRPSSDLPAAETIVATSAYQLRSRVLHAKCC